MVLAKDALNAPPPRATLATLRYKNTLSGRQMELELSSVGVNDSYIFLCNFERSGMRLPMSVVPRWACCGCAELLPSRRFASVISALGTAEEGKMRLLREVAGLPRAEYGPPGEGKAAPLNDAILAIERVPNATESSVPLRAEEGKLEKEEDGKEDSEAVN